MTAFLAAALIEGQRENCGPAGAEILRVAFQHLAFRIADDDLLPGHRQRGIVGCRAAEARKPPLAQQVRCRRPVIPS